MNTYQIGYASLNVLFNYFATYAILSNTVYFTILSFLVIDINFKISKQCVQNYHWRVETYLKWNITLGRNLAEQVKNLDELSQEVLGEKKRTWSMVCSSILCL